MRLCNDPTNFPRTVAREIYHFAVMLSTGCETGLPLHHDKGLLVQCLRLVSHGGADFCEIEGPTVEESDIPKILPPRGQPHHLKWSPNHEVENPSRDESPGLKVPSCQYWCPAFRLQLVWNLF